MTDSWIIERLQEEERRRKEREKEREEVGIQLPVEHPPAPTAPPSEPKYDQETPGRGVEIDDIGGSDFNAYEISYVL